VSDTPTPAELYRLLVEQVQDYAIFALDTQGRVMTWNPGAQRIKQYAPEEIIGRHFSVFYTPEDAAAGLPQQLLDRAARTGHAENEGWRVRKDGARFWARVTITALRDEAGQLTAFAKITRDLTSRKVEEETARRLAVEQAAHEATLVKSRELEALNERLRHQAKELEAQTEEAQSLAEELEQSNEAMQQTLTDVEEARDSAQAAESFARAILESIADPFVVFDANWRYRYVNAAAAPIITAAGKSRTPNDLIGRALSDVRPGLLGTEFDRNLRATATDGAPRSFEAFDPEQGTWSSVQTYPLPSGGAAVQWRDITAVKRAEEASHYLVRASEILGRSLDYTETLNELAHLMVPDLADWCAVDIANDEGKLEQLAVAHVDPEKTRWGRELNRRYPPQEDAPTGAYNVLRTGKPELYPDVTHDMLAAAAVDEEHLRISLSLGIRSVMLVPLTAGDHTLGVLTLVSSESARRYGESDLALVMELAHRAAISVENARLHAEAIEARVDAEAANKAKTEFLATMSHELRTPLNAILGYGELLSIGIKGPVTAEQLDYLKRIERSGRYLLSLVQDVLSFAKLETGRVEVRIGAVSVKPLLAEMETLMLPQLSAANLHFEAADCADHVRAEADPERVRQILINLLSNAVKFTPAGGTVSLGCSDDASTVRLIVRDNGPGIPPEKLEEIFAPFVQLQREARGSQAGTGLGLAISRDLARAMHGDLVVESRVNQGSTFTVELPRAHDSD
jgi:PAS domain S-box-containing protein